MESLLWLVVFGAFFYFMMRFGCGSHMAHGGHGAHGGHDGHEHDAPAGRILDVSSANDPVCGMSVDSGKGYSELYLSREYRFCSRKCLDKFDADPQHYAA